MVEVKRTLVKSIPELWEIADGPELIGRLSAELFRSRPVHVVEREPPTRLAWQVCGTPPARVELALAEKDWGTRVVIRVDGQDGAPVFAEGFLKRVLDDLGSDQRQPPAGPERGPADVKRPGSRIEQAQRPERRGARGRPRTRDLEELSVRIVRRACVEVERAVKNVEHRLVEAEETMRVEIEEAQRLARARFEEAQEPLPEGNGERELGLAQRRLTIEIHAAQDRFIRRAAATFARFERAVGRLQERARRVAAAAASQEVDRHLERSIAPALREIEARLTEAIRGSTDATRADGGFHNISGPNGAANVPLVAPVRSGNHLGTSVASTRGDLRGPREPD
jgi:hypothetical protein